MEIEKEKGQKIITDTPTSEDKEWNDLNERLAMLDAKHIETLRVLETAVNEHNRMYSQERCELVREITKREILGKGSAREEYMSELIDINEASKFLKYSKGSIYQLISKSKIPFKKVGNKVRFTREELTKWAKCTIM